jgi:hypothetical protein
MKSPRIRIQAAALAFILLPAAVGVVAIRASATCERFVRTYVTTPVRNRVSKTTAEAWAQWRIGHPNWKANPKLHRPKYVMTRKEAVEKVEFACSAPLIDMSTDGLFAEADVPPPIVNFPPMESTQITFPSEIPPEVAELTPEDFAICASHFGRGPDIQQRGACSTCRPYRHSRSSPRAGQSATGWNRPYWHVSAPGFEISHI